MEKASKTINFLKKLILKKKEYRMFCIFFFIYVFFGFLFSYEMVIKKGIYFGADNPRVYLDLSDVTYNHYRIKVHPLFLFFGQPIVLFLKGIFYDTKIAIIVLEGIIGSYIICTLHKIFEFLNIEKRNSLIFTLIYGFTFLQIIFSSIPETFIFSSFWLILYWCFVLYAYKNYNGKNNNKIDIAFIVFGISSFGITITNYASYFIGLLFFYITKEQKIKKNLVKIIKINIINMFMIGILCILQKIVWNECPIFLTSIIKGLLGKGYSETAYMNWGIGINKIVGWAKGIFMYSILSPSVSWVNDGYEHLWFGEYKNYIYIFLLLFYFLFFSSFFLLNKKNITVKTYKIYITSLIFVFCSHIGLHFIYGSWETFMYTPHYFYILFIVFAFNINNMSNVKLSKFYRLFLYIFLFVEIINNIYYSYISAKISLEVYNKAVSISQSLIGTLICFIILYLMLYMFEFLEKKFNFEVLSIGATKFLDILLRNLKIFVVAISIICLFICFTHFNISVYQGWLLKIVKYINYLK